MKKTDIKETLEELNIMLHKERNAELKMRIHMLVLLKNGECRKRKEIANRLAVHRNTIRNWLSINTSFCPWWKSLWIDANYRNDLILLLLDNSATHKAKALKIPLNVKLLFIPPYSPELNPIERLWQYIKYHLTFSLIEDLETLKHEVSNVLDKCTAPIIASLTGYSYIIDAINAHLI